MAGVTQKKRTRPRRRTVGELGKHANAGRDRSSQKRVESPYKLSIGTTPLHLIRVTPILFQIVVPLRA